MSQVVTDLVVDGSGALTTLDRYEKGMERAGVATEYSTGAIAAFEKRMEAARVAIERGNSITTESVARKTAEQRAWDNWAGTVDRATALRIRLEREATQAAVAATNAVNLGYTTQEKALVTLIALEQRHAAQLQAVTDQHQRAAQAANTHAAANDNVAMSSRRATSNEGGSLQTANVAAQFQDIGVTAAMGMNPIMIALQQGTQLSAVLNSMQNPVRGLAAAFVSIINPVSLLTIGFVALAAAAIQWFTSAGNGAKEASQALEKHGQWLDKTLAGYDRVRASAQSALDIALKLPQGVVAADLKFSLSEQQEAAEKLQKQVDDYNSSLLETAAYLKGVQDIGRSGGEAGNPAIDTAVTQIEKLVGMQVSISSTRVELEAAAVAWKEFHGSTDDDAFRGISQAAYSFIKQLIDVQAQANSTSAALDSLDRDIQIRISMSQEFDTAMGNMSDLFIDPRSRFDQARGDLKSQYDVAMLNVDSYAKMAGAAAEYDRVLQSINVAEAEANEKANARTAKAGAKPGNAWQSANDNFRQRIDQQRMETDLLGKTTFEIERQRAAFDLLNQAKQAGIPITSAVTDQINVMSSEYAAATVQLQVATKAQAAFDEQLNFYRGTFTGFLGDLKAGLQEGRSFWESLGNAGANALDKIADRALSMAANGLFDMILGSVMGGLGGGATGGSWGNGLWGSAIFNARGNVYESPSLSAYSNQIHNTPQMFAFSKGAGIFAEAGPEAIMPLGRDSQGRLGVRTAANQNQSGGGSTFGDLVIQNNMQIMPGATEEDGASFARGFTREMKRQGPDFFRAWQKNDLRREG